MEPVKEIIYDVKKDFEGGKVTDDSKASIRHLENKADDIRATIIPKFYGSKQGFQQIDDLWLQTVSLNKDNILDTDECSVTFECPEVMWLMDNAGLTYVGDSKGSFSVPVMKNVGMAQPFHGHKQLRHRPFVVYNGGNITVWNMTSVEEITMQAIFSVPIHAYLWNKSFSNDQEKEVEKENWRENKIYPIGRLTQMLKDQLKQELQLLYQMPVDRIADDRQTTQATAEKSE